MTQFNIPRPIHEADKSDEENNKTFEWFYRAETREFAIQRPGQRHPRLLGIHGCAIYSPRLWKVETRINVTGIYTASVIFYRKMARRIDLWEDEPPEEKEPPPVGLPEALALYLQRNASRLRR